MAPKELATGGTSDGQKKEQAQDQNTDKLPRSQGKKPKGNGYGKGTFVDTSMILSKAFISLNERSRKTTHVLLLFLAKRQFATIKVKSQKKRVRTDENKLVLTYIEAESRGIPRNVFIRAIDELLEKGFIEIVNPGGAYKQDKAVYALVDDYLFWRPGCKPIRARKKDVKRGFQGAGKGAVKNFSHTPTTPIHTHADDTHTVSYTHTPTTPIPKTQKNRQEPKTKGVLA